MSLRADLAIISEWIAPGSRLLDLGCGDGALLAHLQKQRQVSGYGLELNIDNVVACIERGVNVLQTDIDAGIGDFADGSFDYVVMTQAIQVVQHPEAVLRDMLRIGCQGIVTLPNFGHWSTRLQLLLKGRMPKTANLPAEWHNTENIHLCTLNDFEKLCTDMGISILKRTVTDSRHRQGRRLLPNITGEIGIYLLERKRC